MLEEDAREGEGSSEEETDGGPQAKAWVGDVAEAAGGGHLRLCDRTHLCGPRLEEGGEGGHRGRGGGARRETRSYHDQLERYEVRDRTYQVCTRAFSVKLQSYKALKRTY